MEFDKADEITEKILLPHPIIYLNGESISDYFYKYYEDELGNLILPDKKDPTARVISSPECNGVAIVYERTKYLHYIEIILTKDFL